MKILFTLSDIRKIASFYFSLYNNLQCLFQFNGVLFTQEIPNEIILLCTDYDVALRQEKAES